MRYRNRTSRRGGISGAIVLIGVALAFVFGGGGFFFPIFFVFLAIAMVVGSLGSLNPGRIYGTLIGAMWMIILAISFLTQFRFWEIFLIGAALSALLGALRGPIMAALLGTGLFGMSSMMNNQPQQPIYYQPPRTQQDPPQPPYYQPSQPTQDPSYQPYQQGYQPPQQSSQPDVYREGGQQHQYPSQYDQPQAQYPQQEPPM